MQAHDAGWKKDAEFVDELGALIQANRKTSSNFLFRITGIKKQYIAARR